MAQRAFDQSMALTPKGTSSEGTSVAGAREKTTIVATDTTATTPPTTAAVWVNEETAEADNVLAILSEGAEIYLRSVLEKALHCARQRQNVDGLRLWHQQQYTNTSASPQDILSPSTSTSQKRDEDRPALSLRLGCDVLRQVARAAGNAATVCQRAEQALERHQQQQQQRRQNGGDDDAVVTPEILARASSLSEVALRPRLGQAVALADAEAKRQYDLYGGRDADTLPPFGRLPKRAKLEVIDFKNGMNFAPPGRRRYRASTNSSSFQY